MTDMMAKVDADGAARACSLPGRQGPERHRRGKLPRRDDKPAVRQPGLLLGGGIPPAWATRWTWSRSPGLRTDVIIFAPDTIW